MNEAPFIQGQHVILRKPKESDIGDRYECGSPYEWVRMLGGSLFLKPMLKSGSKI
jgi:hypothetical protein